MPDDRKSDSDITLISARSRDEWRAWLDAHGASEKRVRLRIFHKDSDVQSISYREAVLDALCFGWVDSLALPYDDESFLLTFHPRRPGSTWSKINRERVAQLIAEGLMRPAGQAAIEEAKASGAWDALTDAQDGVIPDDLAVRLAADETAAANFERFPPSSKRLILTWIASAKRPETRARRIEQTVEKAHRNEGANHPKPKPKSP